MERFDCVCDSRRYLVVVLFLLFGFPACFLDLSDSKTSVDPTFLGLSDPQFNPETPCQQMVERGEKSRLLSICSEENNMAELAANVQYLFKEMDTLLQLYEMQGGIAVQGVDYGNLAEPMLRRILDRFKAIEKLAIELRARKWPDLAMYFDHVTVEVRAGTFSDSPNATDRLRLDLAGEWNRVEVTFFGALASLVLAADDWIFAHGLVLDESDISFVGTQSLTGLMANFIARNPKLMTLKKPWRMKDAVDHLEQFLIFMAGDGQESSAVAGLLAALEEQLARDANVRNNLVQVLDKNENGLFDLGDRLTIEPINEAVRQLDLEDEIPELGDIDNRYLNRDSLLDLGDLGVALLATLKDTAAEPVALFPYLQNTFDDLAFAAGIQLDVRPLNWLALQPGRYFASGKGVRDLLPAIYAINIISDGSPYGYTDVYGNPVLNENQRSAYVPERPDLVDWQFLLECELNIPVDEWASNTYASNDLLAVWKMFCSFGLGYEDRLSSKQVFFSVGVDKPDPGHFAAQNISPAMASAPKKIHEFVWAENTQGVQKIDPDGETPANLGDLSSGLVYTGWQDPSFGGMVFVDPVGKGNFELANNFTVNQTAMRIINYYADAIRDGFYSVAGNDSP